MKLWEWIELRSEVMRRYSPFIDRVEKVVTKGGKGAMRKEYGMKICAFNEEFAKKLEDLMKKELGVDVKRDGVILFIE